MWKRCVSGSYHFVDENDDSIWEIFRRYIDKGLLRIGGQVMDKSSGFKYSQLIYEDDLPMFITKAVIIANEVGWDLDFSNVSLNPDFENIPVFKSRIWLENFNDVEEYNKKWRETNERKQ